MDKGKTAVAPPAWTCFSVGPQGGPYVGGGPIELQQVDGKTFRLASEIRYDGDLTGLEGLPEFKDDTELLEKIRWVKPEHLKNGGLTDLASVPTPLQWFASRYGVYTAAALIHDRLISGKKIPEMKDVYADRYFRFMLIQAGVGTVRAWMMWAAVALRTRWEAKGWVRTLFVLWVALALAGTTALAWSSITGSWPMALLAGVVAPALASTLWGRQFGAGLVIAPAVPFVLPTVLLVLLVTGLFWLADTAWDLRVGPRRRAGAATARVAVPAPLTEDV